MIFVFHCPSSFFALSFWQPSRGSHGGVAFDSSRVKTCPRPSHWSRPQVCLLPDLQSSWENILHRKALTRKHETRNTYINSVFMKYVADCRCLSICRWIWFYDIASRCWTGITLKLHVASLLLSYTISGLLPRVWITENFLLYIYIYIYINGYIYKNGCLYICVYIRT
jgi:hypothetical protein